jgi:hypothetical protein
MTKTKKLETIEREVSTGNIFADLGFKNPEEELVLCAVFHWRISISGSSNTLTVYMIFGTFYKNVKGGHG